MQNLVQKQRKSLRAAVHRRVYAAFPLHPGSVEKKYADKPVRFSLQSQLPHWLLKHPFLKISIEQVYYKIDPG